MAAVTSTLLAAGSLGLSASQMVKANKDEQKAQAASKLAASTIRNTRQQNAFQALQAPDVASLAQQANLQSQAQTVQALQDMGPEGAAMIASVGQGARASNLQAAQSQAGVNYQRDVAQAQAQQGINREQYAANINLEMSQLQGAGQAQMNAQASRNAAISGMFGAAGQIATGIGEAAPLYRERRGAQAPRGTTVVDNTSYAPGQAPGQQQQQGQAPWDMWGQNTMPVAPGSVVVAN